MVQINAFPNYSSQLNTDDTKKKKKKKELKRKLKPFGRKYFPKQQKMRRS